ncbi:MAG TPA: MarR family winged helix-turn-helix transcriptional regulator, partial [Streptomyces sp.]|nr:MarR family winged helix-turn-helix transcriptional regulator [Streptomyces sp.]
VRVRDVPALGGVSKEGVASALGFLERHDLATTGPDPDAARTRVVRLTERGLRAQRRHHGLVREVEARWRDRFGAAEIDALRSGLQGVIGPGMRAGLEPYPEGWRAQRPHRRRTDAVLADPAAALPHHPMVLHRGGFPDGS